MLIITTIYKSYAATISKNNEQNTNDTGISIDANECEQNNEVLVSDGDNKDKNGSVIDLEENLSAKNTDNSQQKELDNASSTSLKEFICVERRHIKRVYLGGVKDGVDASTIKNFMQEKSVKPTFVRMMKGTVVERINVIASDLNKILETSFWPKMSMQGNGFLKINGRNGRLNLTKINPKNCVHEHCMLELWRH